MSYWNQITYQTFDSKLFIILILSLIILILLFKFINIKYKLFSSNKLVNLVILIISIITLGLSYSISNSEEMINPNKYYDNEFEGVHANKYINARYFVNIGHEYKSDNIARHALDIEANDTNEEFIIKYTMNGKEYSYLFTNTAPIIEENEIYKGFQTEYHMVNYGTTLNLDMTFDTEEQKTNELIYEIISLDGEVLDEGRIKFNESSVSAG